MSEPYVLGIGAANIDVHGKSRVPIVMRDSNPGHLRTSAGGVTRNVLENLARLGVRTKLISAVGADLYGEMFIRADDFFCAFEEPGVLEQPPEEVLLEYFRQYARLNEGMGMEYVQLLAIPKNREIFQGNENFELILENLLAGYQSDGRASRRRTAAQWRGYLMTCARGVVFDWVIHNAPDYDLTARMDFVMGEVIKPLLQTEE